MQTIDRKTTQKEILPKKHYVRPFVRCIGQVSGLTLKLGSNTDMQGGHL